MKASSLRLVSFVALALGSVAAVGCSLGPDDVPGETDALTQATNGSEDVFAIDMSGVKLVSSTSAKSIFGKNPVSLSDVVVGMRSRTCCAGVRATLWDGSPDPNRIIGECDDADWATSSSAIFTIRQNSTVDVDLHPIEAPGTLTERLESVGGTTRAVLHGAFQNTHAEYSFFSAVAGAPSFTLLDSTGKVGIAAFGAVKVDAHRIVSLITVHQLHLRSDGSYDERQYVIYARVNPAEHATFRADGGQLFADW
jgi:hypothetical protein